MKISTANLSNYRKGDFIQYLNNVLFIVTESDASTLGLTNEQQHLASTVTTLNNEWRSSKRSPLTVKIAVLDQQRASSYSGLKSTLKSWAKHHHDADKKAAAELIVKKIDSYSMNIYKTRYQEETATLNAIINDFETTLTPQITLLGLNDWVTELKSINIVFDTTYLERTEIRPNTRSLYSNGLKDEAINSYKHLKAAFEARSAVAELDGLETTALFQDIATNWNELIEQYNSAVKRSSNTKDNDTTIDDDLGNLEIVA